LVDWSPGRGSEQTGRRPALVVQTDLANHTGYANTIVAAVSTKGGPYPFHIAVKRSQQNGLKSDSFVKCEQLQTISKERLIGRPFGRISEEDQQRVNAGLADVLGLG
jgi:mRNA-degrading endonuclease toxin of MazEF toxin-antitoxin module